MQPAATFDAEMEAEKPSAILSWQSNARLLAIACLPAGLLWDISWHMSIGRDTFWTPAHLTIQFGGVLPALLFAWEAIRVTFFGTEEERAGRIRLWGAYCSLGGWIAIWGAAAMVTSAPLDDWWHNTYGLDVKIVSPPHALLGLGMFAVMLGVLLSLLSEQNLALPWEQPRFAAIFSIAGGLMIAMISIYQTEFIWPNKQHSGHFYRVLCTSYPFFFALLARSTRISWGATRAALVAFIFLASFVWFLPLFPAQPKLAPIYNPVTHMVPPPFPMLLFLPALGVDLVLRRSPRVGTRYGWLMDWVLAFGLAAAFLVIIFPVQWHFSKFLLSPAGDNWIFATRTHWPYYIDVSSDINRFWEQRDPVTLKSLRLAFFQGVIAARLGLWIGRWMTLVRR